jgi:hypothetical protein
MDTPDQTEDLTQPSVSDNSAVPDITAENPNQGYEDKISVALPSRNVTLHFEQGTPDDVIKKVIQREYPRNGADIDYELNNGILNPKDVSLEDYKKYEEHRIDQNKITLNGVSNFVSNAPSNLLKGAGSLVDLAKQVKDAALDVKSSDQLEASAVEGIARSARNLYGSIQHPTDPGSFRFQLNADETNADNTVENRFKQWKENVAFAQRTQEAQEGKNNLTNYNSAEENPINNTVANTVAEVADPVNIAMMAAPELGLADLATESIGKGVALGGKVAVGVTKPILNVANKVADQMAERMGNGSSVLKGVVASAVPGVKTAATVLSGAKIANTLGETAMKVGQNIAEGTGRMGPLESLGLNPNAGTLDRALATTGRFGGDAILNLGLRTAGGAAEGATIGGLVGGITNGPEGAVQGAGAGGLLGGAGAAIGNITAGATGKLAEANRHADFQKFVSNLDPDTAAKFQTIYNRDGLNAAVRAMDTVGLIKGNLNDGNVLLYNNQDAPSELLGNSRGISFTSGDRPTVAINVDKIASDRTFSHELYHFADSIDQLRPLTEAIQQHIVGTWLTNPDGTTVQASSGLLSPQEISKAFDEYKSKIGTQNPEWNNATTDAQKANLVSKELGAEYLSKLVEGSNPDSLLRGFTSPVRTMLDQVLARQSNDIINGLANRLGNGAKPVDSLVFNNLKEASPALNAMLRDLVRAKYNLDSRIELADTEGTIINARHLSNPAIARTALDIGLAKQNPDGTVSMRSDAELNKEDHLQSQILHDTIRTAPVLDKNEPQMRVVDGKLTGDGISKSQLEAINKNPLIGDKVKEMFNTISQSLNNRTNGQPNTMFIDYGAATKKAFNRITQKYYTKYNDGIRRSQREIIPYELNFNKANEPYMRALDLTKFRKTAQNLATSNKLGPWGKDFQKFYNDAVNYFNNISDPSGVRTRELAGMTPEKATFLNNLVQSAEKGGAAYIRSFTLDRMIQGHLTGERIGYNNMAWQRSKIDWMPDTKTPTGKIIDSKEGYSIIEKNNKFKLFSPDGKQIGIFDTQANAEARGNLEANKTTGEKAPIYELDNNVPENQKNDAGYRVSQRQPDAANRTQDALKENLVIDTDTILKNASKINDVADLIKQYPDFKTEKTDAKSVIENFKNHVTDNLLLLHDLMPKILRDRAKLWYDGARKITDTLAKQYSMPTRAVAGVMASLSPQMDWFKNVSLGERVIDIVKNKQNAIATSEMMDWLNQSKDKLKIDPKIIKNIETKEFKNLDTYDKAVWVRAFDESHNNKSYHIITPEGNKAGLQTNDNGSPSKIGWGGFGTIAKAVSIIENPSRINISDELGGAHKVRNFYNNILLPSVKNFGDVTIDTHAVAAGLLRPLAGSDIEVGHNLGSGAPGSAVHGISGIYGIYADAYRNAALQRGILPREMQSITWEGIRSLFSPEFKTSANKKIVNSIWSEYKSGKISKTDATQQIIKYAGGIKTPDWARSNNP